jgi:hypothetical protein
MTDVVQDDLAVEIAQELQLEGTSVRVVGSIPRQRVVDVSWAARRAGRLIGEHVRTSVTPLTPRPDGEVAVVAVVETEHMPSVP